jgi:hypothetical protein
MSPVEARAQGRDGTAQHRDSATRPTKTTEERKMNGMFSAQQQQAGKVSFAGKTAIGIVGAILISAATVAGLTQQTGASPAHWSPAINSAQPAVAAAAASNANVIVVANRNTQGAKTAHQNRSSGSPPQVAVNAGAATDGR